MKILYSAGNRSGADVQLGRFLKNCPWEVMVAGYHGFNSVNHLDITLDGAYHCYSGAPREEIDKIFGRWFPLIGMAELEVIFEEVRAFDPDLVICDYEPIISNIAYKLGKELWHCSPIHIFDGVNWNRFSLKYRGLLEVTRKNLSKLPPGRKYVLSPFYLLEDLELYPGYKWLFPYVEISDGDKYDGGLAVINDSSRISELSRILNCVPPFDLVLFSNYIYDLSHLESYLIGDKYVKSLGGVNWMFCGGESNYLADAIVNGINHVGISPNLGDVEGLLNSFVGERCGLGDALGQVELMEHFSVEAIEESYLKRGERKYKILDREIKFLHEEIDEFIHSI